MRVNSRIQGVPRALALILLPGILWAIAVFLRPAIINPRCGLHPETCTVASVFFLDRFSLKLNSSVADGISFIAQNITGILSFSFVLAICLLRMMRSKRNFLCSVDEIGLWIKVVLWNGFITETVRLLVQRPRPFVYSDPIVLGMNPAHYNSFFSGHTCFAAASGVIAILLMRDQKPSRSVYAVFNIIFGLLIFTTGTCRVLSGRHFLTDVIASLIAGTFIAGVTHHQSITHQQRTSYAS